jgi:hypothetical protein
MLQECIRPCSDVALQKFEILTHPDHKRNLFLFLTQLK